MSLLQLDEKTFEHQWVIRNWKNVVQNVTLTENTTAEFDLEAENVLYAKYLVGTSSEKVSCVGFYWKLLSKHYCLDNIEDHLVAEILQACGKVSHTYKV